MPTSHKDARRLTGYRGDTDVHAQQSLYDEDMDEYQHYHDTDDVYEEYDEDLDDIVQDVKNNQNDSSSDDENGDDSGSELSIPDPNIDFDMVYALHTFAATVEGQASVVRGDALTLLDDSNSYWWLVKVLKTAEVGYIPAENIETPHERLARLNSHRNVELTRKDIQDAFPAPPSNKLSKKTKHVTLAKGVQFQSQIIFSSGDGSDDEDDFFEAEFEQWNERMRSDDESESSDTDGGEDSDDPYNYYDDGSNTNRQSLLEQSPTQAQQAQQQQQQHPMDMHTPSYSTNKQQDPPADYYNNESRLSADSDILNDKDISGPSNRDILNLSDETIKISLTPSIARGYDDHRASDSSIQSKLKKAAKLERLLSSPEPQQQRRGSKDSSGGSKEKKEKSGIRKFFSRSNSKDSKKSSKKDNNELSRQLSGESQVSISSQSTGMSSTMDRDRSSSLDSNMMLAAGGSQQQQQQAQQQQATKLKIHAGNINHFMSPQGIMESYKFVPLYPTTTATELIHMALHDQYQLHDEAVTYHDYYLIVRTLGGDEFTLVPSDKPLEIYYSLTAHKVTPMPSLKKARRISQLMGSDNTTHMGGPSKDFIEEDEVQFYLLSKTKRMEDNGEFQIKVSLFPSQSQLQRGAKRVDKLVKIPSNIYIKNAVSLLLEKFHILNGVVANNITDDDIKSLRLEAGSEEDIVKYHLALNRDGQEYLLDLDDKLINVFGQDQIPPIHYRRNSNPDRTSITVNITPPEKNELYFILKCVESRRNRGVVEAPVVEVHAPVEEEEVEHHSQEHQQQHHRPHHRPVRHDTPMPAREEHTVTSNEPLPGTPQPYQPQLFLMDSNESREMITSSPPPPVLSSSPTSSSEDILSQLDAAIDTLNNNKLASSSSSAPSTPQPQVYHSQAPQPHPQAPLESPKSPPIQQKQIRQHRQSTESMLFVNDFGMNDLMVMIRGAASIAKQQEPLPRRNSGYTIRSEISEVFKDSQTRLDQLEKELDRLMSEAVKVYH